MLKLFHFLAGNMRWQIAMMKDGPVWRRWTEEHGWEEREPTLEERREALEFWAIR